MGRPHRRIALSPRGADIRVLDTEADLTKALNLFRTAMVGFPQLSGLAKGRIRQILEPGRTFGAFVDGHLVGTTDSATSSLTVPGGKLVGHAAGDPRRSAALAHPTRDRHRPDASSAP